MGKLLLCLLATALASCANIQNVTVQEGQTICWTPVGSELLRSNGELEPETVPDGMDVYQSSFGELMTVRSSAGDETYALELERVVIMRNGDVFLDDDSIASAASEILIEIPAVTEVHNFGYGQSPWWETLSAVTTGTVLIVLTFPLWMYGQISGGPDTRAP